MTKKKKRKRNISRREHIRRRLQRDFDQGCSYLPASDGTLMRARPTRKDRGYRLEDI